MTPDIILVLLILGIALVLFVTEVIWMDLVSLLVLVTLAVTGPPEFQTRRPRQIKYRLMHMAHG